LEDQSIIPLSDLVDPQGSNFPSRQGGHKPSQQQGTITNVPVRVPHALNYTPQIGDK
jgi:hypothetical protein